EETADTVYCSVRVQDPFKLFEFLSASTALSCRATMISPVQWASIGGFLFVLYRAITLTNYPLLESDPKPRESHKWRLLTAAYALALPLTLAHLECPLSPDLYKILFYVVYTYYKY